MRNQGRTREARVHFGAAALLADKLAKAHNADLASILLTAALLEADDMEPPAPERITVAMCVPLKVVYNGQLQPRGDDGPRKERNG